MSYLEKAKEKMQSKSKGLSGKALAVFPSVKKALLDFCNQEEEFAQAIVQSDKTIEDCCKEIMKNVGTSISDIEVYCKAVEFFFPGAKVEFQMKIDLIGDADKLDNTSKIFKLDFTDLIEV